jgi:predicted  nucleic acid-binding Zn-ribbon protein
MEDILDILITIQKIDDEIKNISAEREKIPDSIGRLENEIKKAESQLNEKQERLQEIRKTYKIKEGDIAENENKVTKLNGQTFAVKTNEEYRAILHEIDFLKKDNVKIEDEMINLLDEEEKLKGTIARFESESRDFIDEKSTEIQHMKEHNTKLVERQAQLDHDFKTNFGKLPAEVRDQYNKIKQFRGNAVCLINDETCTGCYANLTPQFLNELKKRNQLLLCDNCGRILIYVDPQKEIENK